MDYIQLKKLYLENIAKLEEKYKSIVFTDSAENYYYIKNTYESIYRKQIPLEMITEFNNFLNTSFKNYTIEHIRFLIKQGTDLGVLESIVIVLEFIAGREADKYLNAVDVNEIMLQENLVKNKGKEKESFIFPVFIRKEIIFNKNKFVAKNQDRLASVVVDYLANLKPPHNDIKFKNKILNNLFEIKEILNGNRYKVFNTLIDINEKALGYEPFGFFLNKKEDSDSFEMLYKYPSINNMSAYNISERLGAISCWKILLRDLKTMDYIKKSKNSLVFHSSIPEKEAIVIFNELLKKITAGDDQYPSKLLDSVEIDGIGEWIESKNKDLRTIVLNEQMKSQNLEEKVRKKI